MLGLVGSSIPPCARCPLRQNEEALRYLCPVRLMIFWLAGYLPTGKVGRT